MFIIQLTYVADLSEIDALMPEHLEFLDQCYAADVFVASGRCVPRTGGVILARAKRRQDVEDLMALDPFVRHGAARVDVTEFRTSQFAEAFRPFADPA